MKLRHQFTCPLELVHDMIRGKWKPIILWRLRLGNTSLSKLERDIEGISQKMLLEHLKELIEFGFVEKQPYEGYPLRVDYFLTQPHGERILEALTIMQQIGIDYLLEHNQEEDLRKRGIIS
ncbi:helix-turn-helix transcriptional regulator [Sporolactobacillus shoreicorticis]|uniref:Winged helix-turn-helix transcriptional regulator n=1 Tax=Sporolactobacillus shoreicorticis TaxID=1923877 RepID=A0ABW5S2S2_9BACL|nr:helix-turn-helix domain-containing protein [Sporolactobacillus shoreicorticis]MCO7125884.1 helix-turn-helix transcriptional regulator [Sporolactobacillus shoreicorticis]